MRDVFRDHDHQNGYTDLGRALGHVSGRVGGRACEGDLRVGCPIERDLAKQE